MTRYQCPRCRRSNWAVESMSDRYSCLECGATYTEEKLMGSGRR